MVTEVPTTPCVGETPEISAVITLRAGAFDHAPPCCTIAVPVLALEATVATI